MVCILLKMCARLVCYFLQERAEHCCSRAHGVGYQYSLSQDGCGQSLTDLSSRRADCPFFAVSLDQQTLRSTKGVINVTQSPGLNRHIRTVFTVGIYWFLEERVQLRMFDVLGWHCALHATTDVCTSSKGSQDRKTWGFCI